MMNLNLKKLFATLGITALALTTNVVTTPVDSLAMSEYAVVATDEITDGKGFTINAVDGQTFINWFALDIRDKEGYNFIMSTNGKDPQWYGKNNKKNNCDYSILGGLTKTTTVKIKCVKDSSNDKTLAKRYAKAKVYTYKFNVINTGVSVKMWGAEETVVDGMNVYADFAGITLGYPGKGINYGELGNVGFYKAKGKLLDANTMKTKKATTKKYDKKYAKLATQTLYYTLDGSTPTTKSKKVAAGKMKTIKVTNPGLNTLKVMGAKEKKVYTYTFYVDTVTVTTVDVPEANIYVSSRMGMITPQNTSIVGYKYFKTSIGFYVYDRLDMSYDGIDLNPGESAEVPHDYFEGKEAVSRNSWAAIVVE